MDIARTMLNHYLGLHHINTAEALKEELGVQELDLLVVDSLEEYLWLVLHKGLEMPPGLDPLR